MKKEKPPADRRGSTAKRRAKPATRPPTKRKKPSDARPRITPAVSRQPSAVSRERRASSRPPLGRFHEIGIATADIRASVQFYEQLGFVHAQTGETWPHLYGVLTDGRIFLGLHQTNFASPSLTFVRPEIARQIPELQARGIELAFARTAEDSFNEIGFHDPAGQMVRVLEARTYSPPAEVTVRSLCGYFTQFSMPAANLEEVRAFWEALGFVATAESDEPYPHLPLTSDHLDIAFHAPRSFDRPLLVFTDEAMAARIERLRELGFPISSDLPRGLDRKRNALIEAPEGTALLLATSGV